MTYRGGGAGIALGSALLLTGVLVATTSARAGAAGSGRAERAASDAVPCRCQPLDLAEYYEAAEEVALARLVSFEEFEGHRVLRMVFESSPWRVGSAADAGRPVRGDTTEYRSARSTATCGVVPEQGAVYVVFGQRIQSDTLLQLDTCSGTRVFRRTGSDGEPDGFQDVPGRFLVQQLDALGALDALEVIGQLGADLDAAPDGTAADEGEGQGEDWVLRGLLDLAPIAHGGVVRVFARPDADAPVLAMIDAADALATREVGYEVPAAAVYDRVEGWSRVRLADGRSGWIPPEDSGTWFPYADLPVRRLSYLTPAWSGYIWPDVGAGLPVRFERAEAHIEEQPVQVLETRMLGGMLWFRVSILMGSPCDGPDAARPAAGGWVPGYGTSATGEEFEPAVWFWSRGC